MKRELTGAEKGCGVVFILILLVAGLIAMRPAGDDRPTLVTGDDAVTTETTFGAASEAQWHRMIDLSLAHDSMGVAGMVAARSVVELPSGTRVRLLGGVHPVEVRVMSGPAIGRAVFVARKMLRPVD